MKPTTRQIYALAAALCELCDEQFPRDREAASELIERFRRELGHPHPRLEEAPHPRTRARSEKSEEIARFFRELNAR